MPAIIESFTGEYRWLSNFWPAAVTFEGAYYPSVEHAYVAAKTIDPQKREEIARIHSPGAVKRHGRKLTLRPDWDQIKLEVMAALTREKYTIPELRAALLATRDAEIQEGNSWGDVFWGMCRGQGANHLGQIIMRERARIQAEEART